LGKTSVIAVWLIALTDGADVPRRLVYVVNRRTVVDQTTAEVERLRGNLKALNGQIPKLAISTLRGQFADNREWSTDPSRPAVIVGTVDMIGSRLLFSGYGVGYKSRPLHAAFLGQDALIVHDEAHLEPAFQKLIEGVKREQQRSGEFGNLSIMQLTATSRGGNGPTPSQAFGLTEADRAHPIIKKRVEAHKYLAMTPADDDKQVSAKIARIAAEYRDANAAILVYVRTLDDVNVVDKALKKTGQRLRVLTGTMRGSERDHLVEQPEFKRFLDADKRGETVYLVCTSAGEVGVDISGDHMVCDLSTLESMTQRLGRVNRFGLRDDTRVHVVYPPSYDLGDETPKTSKADPLAAQRWWTLQLLRKLPQIQASTPGAQPKDASPKALTELCQRSDLPCKVGEAFRPEPLIPTVTDILFDAWSLTAIRTPMPGRPPVEPYLHGIAEWQPPETYVAWRQEVEVITGGLLDRYPPGDLLDSYPLNPRELLRDRSDRVLKALQVLAARHPEKPVWIKGEGPAIEATTLGKLASGSRERINNRTVLLPPSAGGLSDGVLEGKCKKANDVADTPRNAPPSGSPDLRVRIWSDDPQYDRKTSGMRCIRSIAIPDDEGDDESEPRRWEWFESLPVEGGRAGMQRVTCDAHANEVECRAREMLGKLSLRTDVADAVILAARLHDAGKRRERFQVNLGNRDYPAVVLAKSGRAGARLPEPFRHEFASLFDAPDDPGFAAASDDTKYLALHLIAAHHGRARPHYPPHEAFDPERAQVEAQVIASETITRFARLQHRFGRWGLAYLESLLRAADWAASANPSKRESAR
jgi:CRISPR-associated endonuclease/helicase Cas3